MATLFSFDYLIIKYIIENTCNLVYMTPKLKNKVIFVIK